VREQAGEEQKERGERGGVAKWSDGANEAAEMECEETLD
jgi:hypothetical protein